jgi:hypothetical protein
MSPSSSERTDSTVPLTVVQGLMTFRRFGWYTFASGFPDRQAVAPGAPPLPEATTEPSIVGAPGPAVSSSVVSVVVEATLPAVERAVVEEPDGFGWLLEPARLPITRSRTNPAVTP